MNQNVEETATGTARAKAEQPKSTKKRHVGGQGAKGAPKKDELGKKTNPARRAARGAQKAKSSRDGSKAAKVLELLKREGGATASELVRATGWQPHSIRGFLSGTLRKKMNLEIASLKNEAGERSYSIKA